MIDKNAKNQNKKGWGIEKLPYPEGEALIELRWDLCIGCRLCEMACSLSHFGVIDSELSRIKIYRYLLPVPKAIPNVCSQCAEEERECEKACPVNPSAIYYDQKDFHMQIDKKRCIRCGKCTEACPAGAVTLSPINALNEGYPLVCDLCYKDSKREPKCVEICPVSALEFMKPQYPQHLQRIHPDQKAECLAERLYPLSNSSKVQRTPEEVWGDNDEV